MASHVQKDLHCPVCLAIFSDPVILPCSHSFCKACLQDWWREKKVRQCPLCKNTSREKEVLCNLVLKNLCEDFSAMETQSGSEDVCSLHGETLKVFCLDHQEPACVVCRDSETHSGHRFRPVDEAAGLYRKKVQETLQVLKEKMKALSQVKGQYNHATEHIQVQARHTEAHIKQQFQELHRFLEEEEEVRLAALRNQESQKSRAMKEKMEALRREMSDLLDAIRASEKQLRASDVSLLTDLKSTMERVRDEPQMDTGALIDVAKHLGNLGFNIWRRMKDVVSLSPVVLDPNTAHSQLILSEALTAVSCGSRRQLPDNPERIKDFCSVLGSDGYLHSWEVEVENNSRWVLGVLEESVQREGDFWSGLWTVQLCDDRHTAVSQSSSCLLSVKNLKTVRVDLDLDRHKLSFFDADNNTHLHTFTHTFKSKVFPYFWTGVDVPLRILPVEIDLRRISKW